MTSVVPKVSSSRYKRTSLLPRSNVPRVLLHDNASQQHLLDLTLSHLSVQQHRSRRHLELRRRTFLTTQALKQENLSARGVSHVSLVPSRVAQAYSKMTRFYQHNVKRLPPSAHLQEARCTDDVPVYTETPEEVLTVADRSRNPSGGAIINSSTPLLPNLPKLVVGIQRSHTVYRDKITHSTPKTATQGTDRTPGFYRSSDMGTARERPTTSYQCPPMGSSSGRAFTDYRSPDLGSRDRTVISFKSPIVGTPNRERSRTFHKPPGTPGPQYKEVISGGGSKTPATRTLHRNRASNTDRTPEATRVYPKTPVLKDQAGIMHRPPAPRMSPTVQKLAWARPKATRLLQDPRFTRLKQRLQSPDPGRYTDGFLTLSDAGNTVLEQHRSSLAAWQQQQAGSGVVEVVEQVRPVRRASVFYAELPDSPTTSLHYSSDSDTENEGETPDLR